MQMSRLRQGDPTVAIGTELDVIAAVVIGGGSLNGGVGTILGSMVGATIMAVLRNGSQQMGWQNYVQEIIIGAIIVVAVAIDGWRNRRESRFCPPSLAADADRLARFQREARSARRPEPSAHRRDLRPRGKRRDDSARDGARRR